MNMSGVTATQELAQVITKWPAEAHDTVLRMIEARYHYFRAMYQSAGPADFVKAFYEAFDEVQAEQVKDVSCKKGCYLCCRQNVSIFPDEATVIADYCSEQGIPIPKGYLKEQLKYDWKEVAKTEAGWCVFLTNGLCGIYPVRPLTCRKYHVVSAPELCDTVKYPADQGFNVSVPIFTIPEIEASAYCGVLSKKGKAGRMAEMLLPYSK